MGEEGAPAPAAADAEASDADEVDGERVSPPPAPPRGVEGNELPGDDEDTEEEEKAVLADAAAEAAAAAAETSRHSAETTLRTQLCSCAREKNALMSTSSSPGR